MVVPHGCPDMAFPNPGQYPIRVKQGAHLSRRLTWKAGGRAVDLTGYAGKMQIRDAAGAIRYEFSTSPVAGVGTITLGADGTIVLDSADASAIAVGEYRYDLRLTDTLTRKGYVVEGPFEILPSATT